MIRRASHSTAPSRASKSNAWGKSVFESLPWFGYFINTKDDFNISHISSFSIFLINSQASWSRPARSRLRGTSPSVGFPCEFWGEDKIIEQCVQQRCLGRLHSYELRRWMSVLRLLIWIDCSKVWEIKIYLIHSFHRFLAFIENHHSSFPCIIYLYTSSQARSLVSLG